MSKKKFQHSGVVTQLAMCVPSIRMVNVEVAIIENESKPFVSIVPVVAFLAEHMENFVKRTEDYETPPRTAQEMEDSGWSYNGRDTQLSTLILMDGELEKGEAYICDNCARMTIALPWSEDKERDTAEIQKFIPQLENEVRSRIAMQANKKA